MSLPSPRIEPVSQPIAEKIKSQNRSEYTGPGYTDLESAFAGFVPSQLQNKAPLGNEGITPKSQECESRHIENGTSHPKRRQDDDGRDAIRQHSPDQDVKLP